MKKNSINIISLKSFIFLAFVILSFSSCDLQGPTSEIIEETSIETEVETEAETEAYFVQFDSADGSAIPEQLVLSGELTTRPPDPSRAGFTFEGWYLEVSDTESWNFENIQIESSIILIARWSATLSENSTLLSFSINGVDAAISGFSLTLTLPWGTDTDNQIAFFSYNGVYVTVNGKTQTSGETPNNFGEPVEYIVLAENGTSSTYIVTLAVEKYHPSTVAIWNFEDPSVPIGADIFGSYPGTAYSDPLFETDGSEAATYFDGADSVQIESAEALREVDSFSISLWIRPTSINSFKYIVGKWLYIDLDGNYVSDRSWALNFQEGYLVWRGTNNGNDSGEKRISYPFTSRIDVWSHIVATWNGIELELYIDGELVGSNALSEINSTDRPVIIGAGDHGEAWYMNGWIKNVGFYDEALKSNEVDRLFRGDAL
ncbi:MAG: InlB B-repeat-containing protein [Spirochaetia bacterium]|nr:InlB B-repeat-containing protein [Spirochaetia bacterium]